MILRMTSCTWGPGSTEHRTYKRRFERRNPTTEERMMRNRTLGELLTVLAIAMCFSIKNLSAQDVGATSPTLPSKGDARARSIFQQLLDTVREAKSLSYDIDYQWRVDGKVLASADYRVRLKKPGFVRVEGRREEELTGILICDGKRFYLYWPNGRPFNSTDNPTDYEKTRFRRYMREDLSVDQVSISHRIPRLGTGGSMLIFQPAYFFGYQESLHPLITNFQYEGSEPLGDETCDVVKIEYMDGQRIRTYWISRNDHLPRQIDEIVKVKQTLTSEERWTNILLNADMDEMQFSWNPPNDWTEWKLPAVEAGLLPTGTMAPPFELKGLADQKIKLEDFRGKVVWLTFWRVGCPPCRDELMALQAMHEKYEEKGVVFLCVNCSDAHDIAREFLEECRVQFPSVIDTSEEAMQLFTKTYQRNGTIAVPLNYLIDAEGKIAAAWYGYDKDDQMPVQNLDRLLEK